MKWNKSSLIIQLTRIRRILLILELIAPLAGGHSSRVNAAETITYLGSLGSAASKTSDTSLTISTSMAVNAGEDIIVAVATDPYSNLTVSVTDPVNNTYNQIGVAVNTGNVRTYLFAAFNVIPFASGSNISITLGNAVTAKAAVAALFSGLANNGALDQIKTGTGSSTTPASGTTSTTTQADELLIGVVGTEGPDSDAAGTWDTSFTAGPQLGTSGTDDTNITISLGYRIVSTTSAYSASKTGVTSRDWEAMIATFSTTGAPAAFNILLGRPEDTSVTANIIPDQEVEFYIEYGIAPATYGAQTIPYNATASNPIEFVIGGLSANTRYYYRIVYRRSGTTEWNNGAEHSFMTQRPAGSSFTFTVTSDNHLGQYGGQTADELGLWQVTLQNILGDDPDFFIDTGDTFPMDPSPLGSGMTDAETKTAYLYDRPYLGAVTHSIPYFQVLGNHENEEGWNFDDVFTSPDVSLALGGMKYRKLYYPNPVPDAFYSGNTDTSYGVIGGDTNQEDYWAWTWGDALFVVIDPFHYSLAWSSEGDSYGGEGQDSEIQGTRWDWSLGIQQYLWLKSVLENSHAKYKFVFTHLVTGGSTVYGRGGQSASSLFEWGGRNTDGTWAFDAHRPASDGWTLPIHQLMVKNGVSIFFHGHDHDYARELVDGIVYLECPKPDDAGYAWDPYSYGHNEGLYPNAIVELQNSGYFRVNVSPGETKVEYVRSYLPGDGTNGVVADSVTVPGTAPSSYRLMVDKTGPGSGTVTSDLSGINCGSTCSAAFSTGASVTLTAAAASGSSFTGWGGDCSGTGACSLSMSGAHVVRANFSAPGTTYSLTVNAGSNGTISTPAGTTTRSAGEMVSITAVPNSGYHFVNWTGDWGMIAHTTGASTSITMNGNYTITANFAANTSTSYRLTANAGSGGAVTSPSSSPASYTSGTAATLTASANPGYHFVNWIGLVNTVADTKSASTTVVMNGNYVIQANFAPNSGTTYTLTANNDGHGTVGFNPSGGTYASGTTVTLTPSPATGYQFSNWTGTNSGDIVNSSGVYTIVMKGNKTVQANFSPITYSLTVNRIGSGSGTVTSNPTGINCGSICSANFSPSTEVTLTAAASTGSTFSGWDGACSGTGTCQATMYENKDVTATFSGTSTSILGDVNGDGRVNSTDALIILSGSAGIKILQFCPVNCGDVNGDGKVNSTDALIVLSYSAGMSVPFLVGQPGCPASVTPCPGCIP